MGDCKLSAQYKDIVNDRCILFGHNELSPLLYIYLIPLAGLVISINDNDILFGTGCANV